MNPQQQQQQQHNNQDDHNNNNNNLSSLSPSFNTYNTNIMDTISRVITDIESESEPEFEFELEPASLGSFPVYPVFNRDIFRDPGSQEPGVELRKLFLEEDVSPEAYCLWAPRSPETPTRCGSTGTKASTTTATAVSKTWRLRNLLRRCKSDGKEGLMLVADTHAKKKDKEKTSVSRTIPTPTSSPRRGGGATTMRRKSYLPYKQDLLGFFGSPQTLRKINIPPF